MEECPEYKVYHSFNVLQLLVSSIQQWLLKFLLPQHQHCLSAKEKNSYLQIILTTMYKKYSGKHLLAKEPTKRKIQKLIILYLKHTMLSNDWLDLQIKNLISCQWYCSYNKNNNNNLIYIAPVCAKKTSVALADRTNYCD